MGTKKPRESAPRPLDTALFASGLQCAKRLYLDFHHPEEVPDPSENQLAMAEAGRRLAELAREGFPKGIAIDAKDFDKALEQTTAQLAEKKPCILFDAAFRHGDVEVRSDVAIVQGDGSLSVFEVKSGTKVKPRHVMDVALQMYVIEANGYRVRTTNVLHVNAQYRHAAEGKYPAHELFKNADVTDRARKQQKKVQDELKTFRALLQDPATMDLPTGTWCREPFPCVFLASCRGEGPDHPLMDLPELTRQQEQKLHEQGIVDLATLDPQTPGLSPVQGRCLRAVREGKPVFEEFVRRELLTELEFPLIFVHVEFLLEVLPRFVGTRPWQQIPYLFGAHLVHEDGKVEVKCHVAEDGDPRLGFVHALAAATRGEGMLMLFSNYFEARLRDMLEDLQGQQTAKSELRLLLNMPYLEMQHLVQAGVYHPGFRGIFDLEHVAPALLGQAGDSAIESPQGAMQSYLKLTNSRTRANTKAKLREELLGYVRMRSEQMLKIYRLLTTAAH